MCVGVCSSCRLWFAEENYSIAVRLSFHMQRTILPSSSQLWDSITVCDTMRTTCSAETDSKESLDKLRSVLSRLSSTPSLIRAKRQPHSDERRMGETIQKLCTESSEISTKLGIIASTLSSFVGKHSFCALEDNNNQTSPSSYAQAAQNLPNSSISAPSRLEKSKFSSR